LRTGIGIDEQPSGLRRLRDGRLRVVAMQRMQLLRLDHDGAARRHRHGASRHAGCGLALKWESG
jgi:hypothetical protein